MVRENTRAHWVLYALSAYADQDGWRDGMTTNELYDRAGGDEGKIFTGAEELSGLLTNLRRDDLIQRRTAKMTAFDDHADVVYENRLSPEGLDTIRDLGKPTKYPNRQRENYSRELPYEPAHDPTEAWAGKKHPSEA